MQRPYEDLQQQKSGGQGIADHGSFNPATRRFSNFFGANEELPLYKDKPYHGRSSKKLPRPSIRLIVFVALSLFAGIYWIGVFLRPSASDGLQKKPLPAWLAYLRSSGTINWEERQEMVKSAFSRDWQNYSRDGWGYDLFNPMSKSRQNMAGDGIGWVIANGLDTLILMNMTTELQQARTWLSDSLSFDKNQRISTYGAASRILGGLLSAHYLSTTFPDMAPILTSEDDEDLYIETASDLADRLLNAFDSPSGLPYLKFDLLGDENETANADKHNTTIAESTGLQLELRYLSKLTGEKLFWDRAERVMQVINDASLNNGLVPTLLNPESGKFQDSYIKVGYGSDGYYSETLLKLYVCITRYSVTDFSSDTLLQQYLQTSQQEPIYIQAWDGALNGMQEYLFTYSSPSNLTIVAERPNGLNEAMSPNMDHSSCILPGLLALSTTKGVSISEAKEAKRWAPKQETDIDHARRLMNTCWAVCKSNPSKLPNERSEFNIYNPPKTMKESAALSSVDTIRDEDDANWRQDLIQAPVNEYTFLSPKVAESLLYLWRITGDEKYRGWGWELFEAHMRSAKNRAGNSYESSTGASIAGSFQSHVLDSFLPVSPIFFSLMFVTGWS